MRSLTALLFAVSASAQAPSAATTQALTAVTTACTQAGTQRLIGNQACQQQLGMVSPATGELDLLRFCGSSCLGVISGMYTSIGTCVEASRPQLVANLQRDGVANATQFADTLLIGYKALGNVFNFMCVRNERGDFCLPKYTQLSQGIAAASGNLTNICNAFGTLGCCLRAMDLYYEGIAPGVHFTDTVTGICPSLATFAPPTCLLFGQTALTLTVTAPLIGLNCATYVQQDADFQNSFQAALKNDLAAGGLSSNFTVIKSISEVHGVCTVVFVVRAGTDDATRALQTAAFTAVTSSLTQSNQILATVPGTSTGNIAIGNATVAEATISGPSASNTSPGSFVAPSLCLVAAMVMWLA